MQYESGRTYAERQADIEQRRLREDFEAQQPPLPPVLGGLGDFLGNVGRFTEPVRSAVGGPIGTAFDYLSRPGRAVRGGLLEGLTGGDFGGGFMAGLQGQGDESLAAGLERKGVGTMPVGPFDTRGLLGFAGEALVDPLNLIPVGGAVSKGRMALGLAERAAPRLANISLEQTMARAPTLAARGLEAATKLPVLGGILRRVTDIVDPRILEQTETGRALNGFQEMLSTAESTTVPARMAEMLRTPFLANVEKGMLTLTDGTTRPAGDIAQNLTHFRDRLDPSTYQALRSGQEVYDASRSQVLTRFGELPEPLKVNFAAAMKEAELGGAEHFWPRYIVMPDGMPKPVHRPPVGSRRTGAFEREFVTEEEAVAQGYEYLHPVEAMKQRLFENEELIARMDLAESLAGQAEHVTNLSAVKAAGEELLAHRTDIQNLRRVQGVLADVSAGKTISDTALGGLAEDFPSIAREIQIVMSRRAAPLRTGFPGIAEPPTGLPPTPAVSLAHVPGPETWRTAVDTPELRQIQSGLNQMLGEARQGAREAAYEQRWFQAEEATARTGLEQTGIPFLGGEWFAPDEARLIARNITRMSAKAEPILGLVESGTAMFRTAQTTMDFSGIFIQGITRLAIAPRSWLRAAADSIEAAVKPERLQEIMATPEAQRAFATFPNLAAASGEFYQGAGAIERTVGRIPVIGERVAGVVTGALQRSQAAFDTMGVKSRIDWANSMTDIANKTGKHVEIADMINHATGVISTQAMGVGPTQRAVESAFLFAPRYLRASLALVGDMLQGGPVGAEARRTLSSMLGVGLVQYQAFSHLLGQQPVLDPTDARFMTVDVQGNRIGVGTTWISMLRLLAKSMAAPGDFATLEPENPLIRFWRGKTATTPGMAWDIAMHETFDYRPINNIGDVLKLAGTKLFPFAVQGLLEGQGFSVSRLGAEELGLRTFNEGFKDVTQRVAQEKFGKPFDQLDPYEKVAVQQDERVKSLPQLQGQRFERQRQTQGIYEEYGADIGTAAQQVQAGQINRDQFRRRVDSITIERNTRLEGLGEAPEPKTPRTPQEQVYQDYIDVLKRRDEFERRDPDAVDQFIAAQSPEDQNYIHDRQMASVGRLPEEAQGLMTELRTAQETLRPYYDIRKQTMERLGLWDQYKNAVPAEQQRILDSPRGKAAARLEDRLKVAMRLRQPVIDAALVAWHGNTPIRQQRR